MKIKLVSSLEKCFLDEDIDTKEDYVNGSCLKDELFRFGICYVAKERHATARPVLLTVNSDIATHIAIREVQHVPVKLPVYNTAPNVDYLRTAPGLYPDLLTPINAHHRLLAGKNLESLLIEVDTTKIDKAGVYPIEFVFSDFQNKTIIASAVFHLEIIDCVLPKQKLIYTQWFYCDCLMDYYGTKAFDQKHWKIIENYVKTATKNGINMILTPVFTPPLDTFVGGERSTTQLVDVSLRKGIYHFRFDKLGKWIDICRRAGIEYFEISHFFTQWGAAHAPKIMAAVDGKEKRIFGWGTDACGPEYTAFLRIFIPKLLAYLRKRKIDRKCYFHISDEPNLSQLSSYTTAKNVVAPLLKGYPIIDALSNYEFYANGTVQHPIPAINHVDSFLAHHVPNLWTYYCCCQHDCVSNRFLSMPSYRNRILGIQLYKYAITGFLHWGYNFYNSQYSYYAINPFVSTDGNYFAPAGDAFSVYPARDGTALESLRLVVFHDALQDMRALEKCESLYGRAYVEKVIEEAGGENLTFKKYPRNQRFLLDLRQKINQAIKSALSKQPTSPRVFRRGS